MRLKYLRGLVGATPSRTKRLLGYGLDPDPAALLAVYYHNGGYILDERLYAKRLTNQQLATGLGSNMGSKLCRVVAQGAPQRTTDLCGTPAVHSRAPQRDELISYGLRSAATPPQSAAPFRGGAEDSNFPFNTACFVR